MFVQMYGNFLACLTVDMEAGAVFPLGSLGADLACRHSGALDAVVSGSYHCDENPTPDIHVFTVLGLPPLGGNAAGQDIQRVLHLCSQQAVD